MNGIDEIRKQINRMTFIGCEDVLVGDVLYYSILNVLGSGYSGWNQIAHLIWWTISSLKRMILNPYYYCLPDKSRSLFLFSSSYGDRLDLRASFQKLTELFPNSSVMMYDKKACTLTFRKFKVLKYCHTWKKEFKKIKGIKSWQIGYLVNSLFMVFCDVEDAKNAFGNQFDGIDNLISWCDVHSTDSFLVQRFNKMGKRTIDLMHGSISDEKNTWSVHGIKSKVFIADCNYTRDMLIRNNYTGDIKVCGYPKDLGEDGFLHQKRDVKVCGVTLSANGMHQINLDLCKKLQLFDTNGYMLECKLHPTETRNMYSSDAFNPFSAVYGREISGTAFLKQIDAAIICPSTMIFEAIQSKIRFIVIKDEGGMWEAYHMPEELMVNGNEMLSDKYAKMIHGEYDHIYRSLQEEYCVSGNVRDNYLREFHQMGIY